MKKIIFTGLTGFMLAQSAFAAEQAVVSPFCWNSQDVSYLYYQTSAQADARYYSDLYNRGLFTNPYSNTFKPVWDTRYGHPQSPLYDVANHASYTGLDVRSGYRASAFGTETSRWYNAGSIVQTKCVNGVLAGGAMVNMWDGPNENSIDYAGGPQATWIYHFTNNVTPWVNGKNLRIQANFDLPIYTKGAGNIGGNINFVATVQNIYNPQQLFYYVIPVWGYENGYSLEDGKGHDKNLHYVSAPIVYEKNNRILADGERYVKASPYTNQTSKVNPNNRGVNPTSDDGRWPYFFRANISYKSLKKAITDLNFSGAPENWRINMLGIQYEIEDAGGKGSIAGSHYGFRADITDAPQ